MLASPGSWPTCTQCHQCWAALHPLPADAHIAWPATCVRSVALQVGGQRGLSQQLPCQRGKAFALPEGGSMHAAWRSGCSPCTSDLPRCWWSTCACATQHEQSCEQVPWHVAGPLQCESAERICYWLIWDACGGVQCNCPPSRPAPCQWVGIAYSTAWPPPLLPPAANCCSRGEGAGGTSPCHTSCSGPVVATHPHLGHS
jgi:hypothetical protein